MIVDASALVAILRGEEDGQTFAAALNGASVVSISAVTLFEACLVIDGSGSSERSRVLDRVVSEAGMKIVPFESEHVAVARDAHNRYGWGSGHKARLNFGDCMTYATAYIADEPLLYKGNDFSQTDIASAI